MLSSSNPFSTPNALPLEPPGAQHLDALRAKIQALLDQWRDAKASETPTSQDPPNPTNTILLTMQQHSEMARQHLELAYQNWIVQTNETKSEQWRIELMRAYVRESERRKEMDEQIFRVEQEVRRLQAQVDMLSRCQWPREFALFPPEARPFPKTVAQHLKSPTFPEKQGHDGLPLTTPHWDYDTLVRKWKRVLAEDSARTLKMTYTASPRLPPITSHNTTSPMTPMASDRDRPTSAYLKGSSLQNSHLPPSKKQRTVNGNTPDDSKERQNSTSRSTSGMIASDTSMRRSNTQNNNAKDKT